MDEKKEDELKISRMAVSGNGNLEASDEITNQIDNSSVGRPLDSPQKHAKRKILLNKRR